MFLSTKDSNDSSLNPLREILVNKGSCLISEKNLFLTVDQWKTLNHETTKLEYENVFFKDAKEFFSFKKSTIKPPKNENVKNKAIYDVVSSVQSRNFLATLTDLKHFSIERCECHLCEEGHLISQSWFKDNFSPYDYILQFFLDGNYTGGQLVISHSGDKESIYTPQTGDILISTCESIHEMKPIISGRRSQVLAFIQTNSPEFYHQEMASKPSPKT